MKSVYIAGRFRAPSHWGIYQNIRQAENWALEVWRVGAAALCPHLNTQNFQGALPDHVWLEGDLKLLAQCDAVLMIPGWEKSEGAKAEGIHARNLKIPVFEDFGVLCAWLDANKEETK
jgi:hypothetical protein